jgi:hypothetical protein
MGSKKTAGRKGYGGPWSKKAAAELAKEAQDELASLLKRSEAGNITQVQLDTGLKELKRRVEDIDLHIHRAPEGPSG